jgi:hypothetical protein
MQDTFDLICDILPLREIEELSHDIERGGGGLNGNYGISQSWNSQGFIRQSTSESLLNEV